MSKESQIVPGQFHEHILSLSGRKLGAFKRAAKLAGLVFDDYISRLDAGLKRCICCREWLNLDLFKADSSRWDGRVAKCHACANRANREAYIPVPFELVKPPGARRLAPRDGDKLQARHLINQDVIMGLRPDPNRLYCAYCGHFGQDRRHEYHHHMGYEAQHHYDVLPVCSKCHHAQERMESTG